MEAEPNETPQARGKREFQQYKCAVTTGVVCASLAVLFLIISFGVKDILHFKMDFLGSNLKVKLHYFGTQSCINDQCTNYGKDTIDPATCGKKSGVESAAAFQFIGLFTTVGVIIVNALELNKEADLVPGGCNLNMIFSGIAFGCLCITDISLSAVRNGAKGSECSTLPAILERYAVGSTWILVWFAQLCLFIHLVTYVSRRWCKCCTCCCPPPPEPQVQQMTAQPVAAVPVYPQQDPYAQQPYGQPYSQQQPYGQPYSQGPYQQQTGYQQQPGYQQQTGYQQDPYQQPPGYGYPPPQDNRSEQAPPPQGYGQQQPTTKQAAELPPPR